VVALAPKMWITEVRPSQDSQKQFTDTLTLYPLPAGEGPSGQGCPGGSVGSEWRLAESAGQAKDEWNKGGWHGGRIVQHVFLTCTPASRERSDVSCAYRPCTGA
jgi:hypothetical protein